MKKNFVLAVVAFLLVCTIVSSIDHVESVRGTSSAKDNDVRETQLFQTLISIVTGIPQALLKAVSSLFFFFLNIIIRVLSFFGSSVSTTTTMSTATTSGTLVSTSAMLRTTTTTTKSSSTTSPADTSEMSTTTTSSTAETSETSTSSTASATSSTAAASTSIMSTSTISTSTSTTMGPAKTVFITSSSTMGNIGGIEAADAICNNLALTANLTGTYMAWISNATVSPSTRFLQSTFPYVRVDGIKFAESYAALVGGNPLTGLDVDELKQKLIADTSVWTGTSITGESSSNDCDDWTDPTAFGDSGLAAATNSDWTDEELNPCVGDFRLYCFEQ